MSSKGPKNKLNKKENNQKHPKSDLSMSDRNSEIQEDEKSVSLSEKIHQNSRENIKNVLELADKLKKKEGFNKYISENKKIKEIYQSEDKMNEAINGESTWKLNNDLFEERAMKILSDVYGLKEYNMYPYFDVGYSKTKKSNVIKIYFNKINVSSEAQNNDKGEKDDFSLLFLADMDTYMFKYEDYPFIIQKYREDSYTLTVSTSDFQNTVDFEFKKRDKISTVSFILAEISDELMEIKNDIKRLKNEKDSLNSNEQKEEYKNKLKSYEKILLLAEKKYSKESIEHELNKKKIDLDIFEEKINLNIIKRENVQEQLKQLKDNIAEYSKFLKRITITLEKKDREFDGFFFSSKTISLENSIGDKLEIPEKSPIIVETKNIIKYKTIIENIRSKKQLMSTLGFDTEKFYFIGILRGIDVNQEKKDKLNKSIFKDLNMKNMIIIYSENMNFLGQPLREFSTIINNEKNLDKKNLDELNEKSISDMIIIQLKKEINEGFTNVKNEMDRFKKEMKNEMDGFKKEIKNEMDGFKKEIKTEMDGFKKEIKTEISQIKEDIGNINQEMSNIKTDINDLKNKANSGNN